MNANNLVTQLERGCVSRWKRWSGDSFEGHSSGWVDTHATNALMTDAARIIRSLQQRHKLARQDLDR